MGQREPVAVTKLGHYAGRHCLLTGTEVHLTGDEAVTSQILHHELN